MNNDEGLLRILNYGDHPVNSMYLVFHFTDEAHANKFKLLLEEQQLWFEYDVDTEGKHLRYLFAIKKADRKKALTCNYLVKGEFRNKIVPNNWLRWSLLLVTFLFLLAAIVGYFKTVG